MPASKTLLARCGLLLVLVMPVAGLQAALDEETRPPNIIFLIADDMQRYMFNCLPESPGDYWTPHLDRLAREGTVMLGQYVSAPVCTPSRFSCLTGRYASRAESPQLAATMRRDGQSVVGWNTMVQPGQPTVASLLKRAGYRTAMVGKNHAIAVPGRQKLGYREDPHVPAVRARLESDQRLICEAIERAGFDYAASIYHNNPDGNGPRALAVHNLDWITRAGLEFIDQNRQRPFFLSFASTVPHGPGSAERSWKADRRITAAGILDEPLRVLPPPDSIAERLRKAGLPIDNRRANMVWLDDALGALLKRLQQYALEDDTIIFFFNDHGQGAKGTLYQGGISNPSIVWRQGGFPCGATSSVRVSNVDFAPTMLELAGAEIRPDMFDGVSFLQVLQGEDKPIHPSLYCEMGYTRAVIKDRWKYLAVRYPERARRMTLQQRAEILDEFNRRQREHDKRVITEDPRRPFSHISLIPGGGGAEAASTGKYPGYYDADQLYDLSKDPRELQNLADDPQHADVLSDMQRELQQYLKDLPGGFAELKPAPAGRAD